MRASTLETAAAVAGLCAVSAGSAVVEAFLVPYELVPAVSVATVAAVVLNPLLALAGRAAAGGRTYGAMLPAVFWLVVVAVLSSERREGDLVVQQSAAALLFMIIGAGASAVAIARSSRTTPVRPIGPMPESSSPAEPRR